MYKPQNWKLSNKKAYPKTRNNRRKQRDLDQVEKSDEREKSPSSGENASVKELIEK